MVSDVIAKVPSLSTGVIVNCIIDALGDISGIKKPSKICYIPARKQSDIPRLQKFFRQVEAEVVSNSRNKIHQTWIHSLAQPCISTVTFE